MLLMSGEAGSRCSITSILLAALCVDLGSAPLLQWIMTADSGGRDRLWFSLFSCRAACHLLFSFKAVQDRSLATFNARWGEKKKEKINKSETRRGKMRERVRRIKATWDGEIEFKSAANKWCTQRTCARRKRRRQTRVEGRKQTCYQGLERGAEPFNNFLSALKWKHKRGKAALWMLRGFGWERWPSCNRWVVGWNTCCSHCVPVINHMKLWSLSELKHDNETLCPRL